jgi:hypothetical protein
LATYLGHDPGKAKTSERVLFTHTFNLAHDDVAGAVAEMVATFYSRDLLKEEAGIAPGGPRLDKPVKHAALSWSPEERVSREEMIAAAQSFLKDMGWDEHQCVLFAHQDKKHQHVHLMLNQVHPERGTKLDDGFEKRRASDWARVYEQARGRVLCEERLKPVAERSKSEHRGAWQEIVARSEKEAEAERDRLPFDPSYVGRSQQRHVFERREWELLKAAQKEERLAFIAGGKKAYKARHREVYAQVREEFRGEWAGYFAAKREGFDAGMLADMRADILVRQKEVLEGRRDEAMVELRAERDLVYAALLDGQREERGLLIGRQELGLRSFDLLDQAYPTQPEAARDEHPTLDEALDRFGIARGRTAPDDRGPEAARGDEAPLPLAPLPGQSDQPPAMRTSRDLAAGLAGGIIGALGHLGESLVGGHSRPPPKKPEPTDALERFGIQRGVAPPGDAGERTARAERDSAADWKEWRAQHGLAESRER